MGKEATCRVRLGEREWMGKAHLVGEELTIRGETRIVAPLRREATVVEGWLRVPTSDGELGLELGVQAEKWAKAILNPPTLLDKLGLKVGMSIAVLGFTDVCWLDDLSHATALSADERFDAILLMAEKPSALDQIAHVTERLNPRGMLWVVFPKGRQDIADRHVFAAGKGAGLVDIKTCRFNALLTGLKFVRPKT